MSGVISNFGRGRDMGRMVGRGGRGVNGGGASALFRAFPRRREFATMAAAKETP